MSGNKFFAIFLWSCMIFLIFSYFFLKEYLKLIEWSYELVVVAGIVSFATLGYYLFIALSAFFYHSAKVPEDSELPGCTIILPAYNEGRHVAETLESILHSEYPAEKVEIIAVNDGSADDTLDWIKSVSDRYPSRISVIDFPKNRGKKHGLYAGIIRAANDIIVTVDSDTILEKRSLKEIVAPFSDPQTGGVAGNIRIRNLGDGIIPRMMDVGFMFGFEVIRCAQSQIGCVMCTPGALSAYRKSMLLPFLQEWLEQQFWGVPAKIGEDRSLATKLIQQGRKVVFQRDSIAHTCIPADYCRFCNMMIRWTRSDIRENGIIFFHSFRRYSFKLSWIGLQYHSLMQWINTLIPGIFPIVMCGVLIWNSVTFIAVFYSGLICACIAALIPAMIYSKRVSALLSVWGIVFSIYNIFCISWIVPYSFATVRNSKWLTRELPKKKQKKFFQESSNHGLRI